MFETLKELYEFSKEYRKFWLIPIVAILLIIGVLVVLGQGSVISPFIYTLF